MLHSLCKGMSAAKQAVKTVLSCGGAIKTPNPLAITACGLNMADSARELVNIDQEYREPDQLVDCNRVLRDPAYRRRVERTGIDVQSACAVDSLRGPIENQSIPEARIVNVPDFVPEVEVDSPPNWYSDDGTRILEVQGEDKDMPNFSYFECPSCGTRILNKDANYCQNCGESL